MKHILLLFLSFFLFAHMYGQFSEVTQAAGVSNPGNKNWGISFADYDNDGDEDMYAFTRINENQLFENQGNGTFKNIAPAVGVHHTGSTRAAVWGDINNDGWIDLYLANYQKADVLFLNLGPDIHGDIHFSNIAQTAGILNLNEAISVHMTDVNQDGFLDIYVANFLAENILYINNGDLTFFDATFSAGVTDASYSMGCIFFDYDLDGDEDLYLAHDFLVPNILYQNDGKGNFTNVAQHAGVDYVGHGMGVDIADINNDGLPDMYITDMDENVLYLNQGDGTFQNIAKEAGVNDTGMGWSTFFLDLDNDGWMDIYVINDSHFTPESNVLYRNKGNNTFEIIDQEGPICSKQGGIGGAYADVNRDGFMDIAIANVGNGEGNQLFNNQGNENTWIAFQLEGSTSNRSAIGTRIKIEYDNGKVQMDQVTAGSGFASQGSLCLHFGLGRTQKIEQATVYWPNGIVETHIDLAAGNLYHFTEKEEAANPLETQFQFLPLQPNPFQLETLIGLNIPVSGRVNISIYDLMGRKIQQLIDSPREAGRFTYRWQASGLNPGQYVIKAEWNHQEITSQLVEKY